ncbi:MAG: DRTGG domain-containing protein [Hungatella sp.]
MTIKELAESGKFRVINLGADLDRPITKPFCCDLLSIAMGKAPAGSAWVTVMGNMNTLAVAALADVSCVVMAEGAELDEVATKKAGEQEITVLAVEEPIFEAAQMIDRMLHG